MSILCKLKSSDELILANVKFYISLYQVLHKLMLYKLMTVIVHVQCFISMLRAT